MITTTPSIPSIWHGTLDLDYAREDGQTRPIHSQTTAPLKLQRPFYPEGDGVCHSVVLHTAGGVVGGDRLDLNIRLQPHTHALITTTAASKLYRSNGLTAQQTLRMQVAEGACLEWLPQEAIAFNGAEFRQDLRVELAETATWLGWEMTRFGRTARGEEFVSGNWRSQTEVWRNGQPLWIDRQWLPGQPEVIHSIHGLAGQPLVASLAWIGQPVTAELVTQARELWSGTAEVGVTRLTHGLLCRYRGDSTEAVRSWFIAVWNLVRSHYHHRPACPPRVWPL